MTTIAYRDGVLAADSLVTSGGMRAGSALKIWRTHDGSLWGVTGKMTYLEALRQWSEGDQGAQPPNSKESVFIRITRNGEVREWWEDGWIETNAPFFAWGSGDEVALGAMAMGATADRAVEIAKDFDTSTGGEIIRLALTDIT